MIDFRCWFCNRRYSVADARVGERWVCACGRRVKVPRRPFGASRAWTAGEWLAETAAYAFGGALLGFGLGLYTASRGLGVFRAWKILTAFVIVGALAGAVFGERGVNWAGRRVRAWEDRLRGRD